MKWIDDLTMESLLRDMGIKWKIVTIKQSEIDFQKTMDNVGRITKLGEDKVDEYRREMSRGTAFPRMVAANDGNRWVIIDGTTRYRSAKKNGETAFPVYAVECDILTQHALAVRANRANGHRTTQHDLARQAVKMVMQDGMKCSEVSRVIGVTPSAVSFQVRVEKMRRLMTAGWGISAARTDAMANETLDALTRLEKMPVVQRAVAEYAIARPTMTTAEIKGFINEVLTCQSEEDRLEVVRLAMVDMRSGPTRVRKKKATTLAAAAAKSIKAITTATAQGLTSAELRVACQQLTSLQKDLERALSCVRSSAKSSSDSQDGSSRS